MLIGKELHPLHQRHPVPRCKIENGKWFRAAGTINLTRNSVALHVPQALNTITRSAGLYSALVPSDSSHNALKRRQDYRQGWKERATECSFTPSWLLERPLQIQGFPLGRASLWAERRFASPPACGLFWPSALLAKLETINMKLF